VFFLTLDAAMLLQEGLRDALSTTIVTPQAIGMKETATELLTCSGGPPGPNFTEQFVKFAVMLCDKLNCCMNNPYIGN